MVDLSTTIAPRSDQLNSDDLIGGPKTITVTRVTGNEGSSEQPINVYFDGDNGKPYRPCKSMRRVMVQVWGKDGTQYPGRSMTLYRDPEVVFGGLKVGGTRISHMSHIDTAVTMALTATRANKKPFTVKPLATEQKQAPAQNGRAKAETWLASYEADLKAATTTDQLAAIHAKADKAVAKLAKEYPDLHERALALRPFTTATGELPADGDSLPQAGGVADAGEREADAFGDTLTMETE